jgi:hypothetical protein
MSRISGGSPVASGESAVFGEAVTGGMVREVPDSRTTILLDPADCHNAVSRVVTIIISSCKRSLRAVCLRLRDCA